MAHRGFSAVGHYFFVFFSFKMSISLQWVVRGTPLGLEDNLMTNEQREKITALRHQGYGYTAIANSVGLSKDSVKAYCRSHCLAGEKAEKHSLAKVPTQLCLNCGKVLIQHPGRKQKKFCCPECRTAWWNAHPEAVKQKAVYTFTCPKCKKEFTAYGNAKRKYCSHGCYIAARFKGGDA